MIELNKITKKLLLLQRNELLSVNQKFLRKRFGRFLFTNIFINFFQKKNIEFLAEELFKKEIDTIKLYLPNNVQNIMDIGCGLGLSNIFLNKIYNSKANFYLLDKNKIDKKIKYGFNKNYESYNNLYQTKKILINNGLNEKSINIFDVEKIVKINEKIDLVVSLKSMGYHYPFENYIELFKSCCTTNTIFIFDVAEDYYEKSLLKNIFDEISVIYTEKSIHSLKRLCCTKIKFTN